jgi:hypothetical protein
MPMSSRRRAGRFHEIVRNHLEQALFHSGRPGIERQPDHQEVRAARHTEIVRVKDIVLFFFQFVRDLEIVVFRQVQDRHHRLMDARRNSRPVGLVFPGTTS